MAKQTRKKFIHQIGLGTLGLLSKTMGVSGANFYFKDISSNNVTYYERGDENYETLKTGFNKRIKKYPKLIALCKNPKGVAEAIQYATKNNLQVTVKSGGHCMEGFSSNDGGLVINLSLLNTLRLLDDETILVGPACTLKQIYETLIPKRKYLPGGSCQTVAIGGLTLGGGYGLMSRTYGLTCDSLREASIVTGDGKLINTKNNPELLWALKGGGNGNFGVVTEMKFKIHTAPTTMQSYKFRNSNTTISNAIETCKQWFNYTKRLPNSCFSAFIFNGRSTYILLTNIDRKTTDIANFIDHFKSTATKFTQGNKLPLGQALKAYYAEAKPITFKNASAGLYKRFEDIQPVLEDVFELIKKKPGILYQINTLGGNIQSTDFEVNAAFPHRNYPYFSELQAYWESEAATQGFVQQFELIQQQFAKAGVAAQYRNYPDINFKNWAAVYYGKNLGRLQLLKTKYDPTNIFRGPQIL